MSTMPVARTWTDGEIPDATIMNAYVRDGFLATLGKLDSTAFTSSQASITFSGISTVYAHLMLVGGYGSDTSAAALAVLLQFNTDTAANYNTHLIASTGSAASGADVIGSSYIFAIGVAGNADAKQESGGFIIIPNYQSTNYKTAMGAYFSLGSTAAGALIVAVPGGMWKSTAAITSIKVSAASGGFSHGNLTLYGLP